jgi:hypothetical protein
VGFVAEDLLNNRLRTRASGVTEKVVTQTKQTKIGLCEQVRVNWKTVSSPDPAAAKNFCWQLLAGMTVNGQPLK